MERDFMGLSTKDRVAVKEEFVEGGCEDSGFARSSGLQWPLSNKVSGLPQFMPMKYEHDDKPSKVEPDVLIRTLVMDKVLSNYPNYCGTTVMQQFLGRIPFAAAPQLVLPSTASVAGATEQWINPKASSAPSQLTIFYGGTVNVFDNITPEKAIAIMFLAGHSLAPSYTTQPKAAPKVPAGDQPPNSGHLSPMSISSHPIDPSNSPAANDDDVQVPKTLSMPATVGNKVEPPKKIPSMRSVAPSAMISSAVPLARKASLARFLEKRKERVMNASPYTVSKKPSDLVHPKRNDIGFSTTSGVGSSSFSAGK